MATKIQPISGFPEYLPAQQLAFNRIVETIAHVYRGFGFVPLETAAVERIEILTAKGIDSKEVYGLRRLNVDGDDDGAKDVALRFDLTVPLARYVVQNYANLVFPFRRYQVQPVWRGERPKEGRYRQFAQFDIDTIADGVLPLAADAEVIAAAHTALVAVLQGASAFTMRVNNRKLLQALMADAGYSTPELQKQAIKVVDDMEKVPTEVTVERLTTLCPTANVSALLGGLQCTDLEALVVSSDKATSALNELKTVLAMARKLVGEGATIVADLTIARGLDYYTGTVVETRLEAAPKLGSICSGGRYDNLTASLSDRAMPGVGVSIGISRLAYWLMQQAPYNTQGAGTADVFLACQNADALEAYAAVAQALRAQGVAVEQALAAQNLGTQLKNAAKRGIGFALIANADELAAGTLNLKNLNTGEQQIVTVGEVVAALRG